MREALPLELSGRASLVFNLRRVGGFLQILVKSLADFLIRSVQAGCEMKRQARRVTRINVHVVLIVIEPEILNPVRFVIVIEKVNKF